MRGLKIEGSWLSFYIRPADGFELPKIMQWLKQTFSLWFNLRTGRKGHTWGERYESEILFGEPPEGAEEADWAAQRCALSEAGRSPAAWTWRRIGGYRNT
jgi:hypothetical protein